MDVFKQFATSDDKELNGTIVEIEKGVTLTVARHANRRYNRRIIKLFQEHADVLNTQAEDGPEKDAADAMSDMVMAQLYAETVLLGWNGLEYKGKPIEYSRENAEMMLRHREFRNFVEGHARNVDNFKLAFEEEQEKN